MTTDDRYAQMAARSRAEERAARQQEWGSLCRAYYESGVLTTHLLVEGQLAHMYYEDRRQAINQRWEAPLCSEGLASELVLAGKQLEAYIDAFERRAWYGGLQALVMAQKCRGLSGAFGGMKVLIFSVAGRCMLTMQEGEGAMGVPTLTLITAETEKPYERSRTPGVGKMGPMGLQSIDATLDHAFGLITGFGLCWEQFNLRPDDAVHILGT